MYLTFKILNDEENNKIDNLVLNSNYDGSFSAYIAEYFLTPLEKSMIENGEILTEKIPSTITKIENSTTLNVGEMVLIV